MELTFESVKIKKICENTKYATRLFGPKCATKIQSRIADIIAADNVADLVAGKPHPLKGNRAGQLSISLAEGTRLVIQPNHDCVPKNPIDGSVD